MNIKERFGDFDVIIVGSGPAGLSVAKRALQLNKKVINFDWGPHTFPNYSALLNSNEVRSTGGMGGTAHHWGGQFGILSEVDRVNWEVVSGFDSEFFLRLEAIQKSLCLDFGGSYSRLTDYDSVNISDKSLKERLRFTIVPPPIPIMDVFDSVASDSRYTFVTNKKLKYIKCNNSQSRTLHFTDESIEIGSIPVVIAAGCVEASRIVNHSLIVNGIKPPKSLGKFLSCHPSINGSSYKVSGRIHELPPESLIDGVKRKHEVIVFRPSLGIFQSGIFEIRKEVNKILKNPCRKSFYKRTNLTSIFYLLLFQRSLSRKIRTLYRLWYQIEQIPSVDSELLFNVDEVNSSWKLSPEDIEMFAILEAAAELKMLEYSLVKVNEDDKQSSPMFEQAYHPSGTLRPGPNSEEYAVNPRGKIYMLPETWVASSAIFPTAGWVNPSLIIMALGQIVLDDIFERELKP